MLTADTFSSKSVFRAQLLNVFFQNTGSLRMKIKLDNSVEVFVGLKYCHSP